MFDKLAEPNERESAHIIRTTTTNLKIKPKQKKKRIEFI